MIDNENKNINDESNDGSAEDVKAFSWGWREEEPKAENPAQDTPAQEAPVEEKTAEEIKAEDAPAKETPAEESVAEETSAEGNSGEQTEEKSEEKTEESIQNNTEEPKEAKEEKAEKPQEKQKAKKSMALPASCILSACSIILLVAFGLLAAFGVFPFGNGQSVNIGVSGLGQTQPNTEASSELLEDFLNSVVMVQARNDTTISMGTGVIITEDGYIVTNHHVIEDTDTVTVQLYGEKNAIDATVVGFKAEDDIAVLKIERTGLRAAPFAKSSDVRYGERVYAIGHPESTEFSWSIAEGIISCPHRQLMIYDDEGILERKLNVVQTDAALNQGNSGGPLINVRGEIVGIVTLKRSNSVGLGFALPADGVLIDVTAIIKTGSADGVDSGISKPRPLLGITGVGVKGDTYYKNVTQNGQTSIEEVDEAYAKANPKTTFYAPVAGVHVSMTSPGSDAAKHLKTNDVITEVNGQPVTTIYDVMRIVNEFDGGDKVSITYYRDGKYTTVELTLKTSKEIG